MHRLICPGKQRWAHLPTHELVGLCGFIPHRVRDARNNPIWMYERVQPDGGKLR